MARTSQTEIAVLGALSVEPMTGYRVRAAISETLGHFWHESFGQIYPALAALETAGLVEREEPGTTSKGRFRITSAGQERLTDLLSEPFGPPPARNPLLLRLFFGRHVDPALTRRRLVDALADAEARSEELARLRAEVAAEAGDTPDAVYWLATVSAGEHGARATADWARETLALLEPLTTDGGPVA